MPLETPRLLLRETVVSDAAAFSIYNERPEFHAYITRIPDRDETVLLVERNIGRNNAEPRRHWYLTLIEKTASNVVGTIGIYADEKYPDNIASIGYALHPDYWGKGLGSEALLAMTRYAHDTLRFHRVQITADLDNIGSWRVMEKCGYDREGIYRYAYKTAHGWRREVVEYASVRPDLIAD